MCAGVDRRILSVEISASGRESWGYLSHTLTTRGLAILAGSLSSLHWLTAVRDAFSGITFALTAQVKSS